MMSPPSKTRTLDCANRGAHIGDLLRHSGRAGVAAGELQIAVKIIGMQDGEINRGISSGYLVFLDGRKSQADNKTQGEKYI